MSKLEEKEQQLKALREEGAQQKKMAEAEQVKARRTVKDMKKQLSHERGLKLDAFHHFEDMVAKVCAYMSYCVYAHTHTYTHTHTHTTPHHTNTHAHTLSNKLSHHIPPLTQLQASLHFS